MLGIFQTPTGLHTSKTCVLRAVSAFQKFGHLSRSMNSTATSAANGANGLDPPVTTRIKNGRQKLRQKQKMATTWTGATFPHVIIGLGNQGKEYKNTRHNIGREFLDFIAKKHGVKFDINPKFKALTTSFFIESVNKEIILVKPRMFMNVCGKSAKLLLKETGFKAEEVLLAQDEMQKKYGSFMYKQGGSALGHRGILSCYEKAKSKDFWRCRLGIGRPATSTVSDFVLERFTEDEEKKREAVYEKAWEQFRTHFVATHRGLEGADELADGSSSSSESDSDDGEVHRPHIMTAPPSFQHKTRQVEGTTLG